MNTIRFIAENEHFGGQAVSIIEVSLQPLLALMVDPSKIDFDDDLVFCIEALLKKAKGCSQIMMEIYPFLPQFQIKNGGILANLVSCMNSYIVYGADFIQSDQARVDQLFQMILSAINVPFDLNPKNQDYSNNIEGCLLLQLALQHLSPQNQFVAAKASQVLTQTILPILKQITTLSVAMQKSVL